jgi:ATP-dependent Zn protease
MKHPETTAYHEAGHVITDALANYSIESVTIIPNSATGHDGLTDSMSVHDIIAYSSTARELCANMREYLVTVVSGNIAESMASGSPLDRDTEEYERAADLAVQYRLQLNGIERDARRLLRKHWTVVERVAQALLVEGTLDRVHIEALMATLSPS